MVPSIMVQHFVHSHYISYGTVKSMNYAMCDLMYGELYTHQHKIPVPNGTRMLCIPSPIIPIHYKGGSLVAFSPFLTLSVVTEPLYTTMRSPLECVETHRLVISRFCQLLDRSVVKIDRNLASKPSTRHHSTPTVSS